MFSIIIPIYNSENFLEECLNSIFRQDYSNYEVLMIDDGSTDKSSIIAEKYEEQDERFHLIKQENRGVSVARNNGIRHAKGDYVVFVDSDDYILSGYLSALNKELSDKDIIINRGYYSLSGLKKQHVENGLWELREREQVENIFCLLGEDVGWPNATWNNIYKIKFLREHNLFFDSQLSWAEDVDFFMGAIYAGASWTLLSKCFYVYNKDNDNSLTHKMCLAAYQNTLFVSKKWFFNCKKDYGRCSAILSRMAEDMCAMLMNAAELDWKDRKKLYLSLKEEEEIWCYVEEPIKKITLQLYKIIGYPIGSKIVYWIYYGVARKLRKIEKKKWTKIN